MNELKKKVHYAMKQAKANRKYFICKLKLV